MSRRIQQVAEVLRREISQLMLDALPPELGRATIIEVIISDDLKNADLYLAISDSRFQEQILAKLADKKAEFQQILGRKLKMRYTPRLNFKIDESAEDINKIEKILGEI